MLVAAMLSGACVANEADLASVGIRTEALAARNGVSLNGRTLNGRTLNGRTLNGRTLNGRTLNGRTLNGVVLASIELRSAELVALTDDGDTVGGASLVGATFDGELDDGTTIVLGVDEASPDPSIAGAWLYRIWFEPDGSGERDWACGLEDSSGALTPIRALPLAGRWDYSAGTATGGDRIDEPGAITLACQGAVLAKCAELGYAPWSSAVERGPRQQSHDVSLAWVHQACTRMLRADYCGDGFSHTIEGVALDAWDAFGIEEPVLGDHGRFEAEWTSEGARCFSRTRLDDAEAQDYVDAFCPDRWDGWDRNARCGRRPSDFYAQPTGFGAPLATRALLMNETTGR